MIRKVLITLLFLSGTALAACGLATLWTPADWRGLVAEKRWAMFAVDEGNVVVGHAHRTGETCPIRRNYAPLGRFGVIGFTSGCNPNGWRYLYFVLPIWILVTAFFTYPAIAFYRGPVRRWRWRKHNCCTACGYSLMGNISGICPECGGTATPTAV
jgi:hypothetical protein